MSPLDDLMPMHVEEPPTHDEVCQLRTENEMKRVSVVSSLPLSFFLSFFLSQ
jgi:hypothetical protein